MSITSFNHQTKRRRTGLDGTTSRVRETKKAAAEHPWRAILSDITGDVGHDGVERIATDRLFDLLDVFLPNGCLDSKGLHTRRKS